MSDTGGLKTYRGSCHCGAYIFEVRTPEIKTAIGCNCSSCSKKAYLWLFLPEGSVTVVKDEGLLTEYTCGPHTSTHRFCSRCGTSVFATNPSYRPGTAVNARALQLIDIWSLIAPIHDGAKIDPQWIPPTYTGPSPSLETKSASFEYHGSCRCGIVQIAVKLPAPLDSHYPDPIIECNCSICQRGGYIQIYVSLSQIVLINPIHLTGYSFANKVWKKMFCKVCGVHVMTDLNVTEEEFKGLPEEARKANEARLGIRPVNVRVLNGLGFGFDDHGPGGGVLKVRRVDGWRVEPWYVNP